jgi:hypothetical protein
MGLIAELKSDGVLMLRRLSDITRYEDAVSAFSRGGGRAALFESLLAIGVGGSDARWHVENRGARRMCFVAG